MKTIEAQVIDSTHLRLMQPIQLPKLTRVRIFVTQSEDDERAVWLLASAGELNRAYGEDEPEYPTKLVKEANPDYAPE
jgi:hypothetical protein